MSTRESEIENLVKLSMQPGGEFDPLGTYAAGAGISVVQFWLEEALTQSMTPAKWEELSKLLRGGFNDQAAKLIRDVAEAHARKCAEAHYNAMRSLSL